MINIPRFSNLDIFRCYVGDCLFTTISCFSHKEGERIRRMRTNSEQRLRLAAPNIYCPSENCCEMCFLTSVLQMWFIQSHDFSALFYYLSLFYTFFCYFQAVDGLCCSTALNLLNSYKSINQSISHF